MVRARARPYEVFIQNSRQASATHVGSVLAMDDLLALQNAKEVFARRDTPVTLWVVRRDYVVSFGSEQEELLRFPERRTYRQPSFFNRRRNRQSEQEER